MFLATSCREHAQSTVKYPTAKAGGFYRPVALWATSWPRNKIVMAALWSRSSSVPHSQECQRSSKALGTS